MFSLARSESILVGLEKNRNFRKSLILGGFRDFRDVLGLPGHHLRKFGPNPIFLSVRGCEKSPTQKIRSDRFLIMLMDNLENKKCYPYRDRKAF